MNEIDRILDELEDFIERARSGFGSKKVSFSKDHILDYVDRLKISIPEQVKMAKRIVENEEAIILKANKNSEEVIEAAKLEAEKILDESNLINQAYERSDAIIAEAESQANKILLSANSDAMEIRRGALSYAADMLAEIEKIYHHTLSSTERSFSNVLDTLKANVEDLSHNRMLVLRELGESEEEEGGGDFSEEEFLVNVSPEDFFDEEEAGSYEEDV